MNRQNTRKRSKSKSKNSKRSRSRSRSKSPKNIPELYHGSPYSLHTLEARVPRGNTPFQTQKAVFLTSDKHQAALYSLARNKERKSKGWGIKGDQLYLRNNLWQGPTAKYTLNPVGYRHTIKNTKNAVQNPELPTEWVIPHAVHVNSVNAVKPNNYADRIHYVTRDELYAL